MIRVLTAAILLSVATLQATAAELPVLSAHAGRKVSQRCAWAPKDSSVCRAREFCKQNAATSKCAKYCTVNPYDVVCGDLYRTHHYVPAPPSYDDSPYPWARSGGDWCDQNPGALGCVGFENLFDGW